MCMIFSGRLGPWLPCYEWLQTGASISLAFEFGGGNPENKEKEERNGTVWRVESGTLEGWSGTGMKSLD